MFNLLRKSLPWIIVVWFALLQTVSPFIHAHLEPDSPSQGHGLHMHEISFMQLPDTEHTLKNVAEPMHTIGVNNALVKSVDALPLPLFAVLFIISLSVVIVRLININLITHSQLPLYLRSLSRQRAPPLF
jgi:hypothetical protein